MVTEQEKRNFENQAKEAWLMGIYQNLDKLQLYITSTRGEHGYGDDQELNAFLEELKHLRDKFEEIRRGKINQMQAE